MLGLGDMLFLPPGASRLIRIHGALVEEAEVRRVTAFLRQQGKPAVVAALLGAKQVWGAIFVSALTTVLV